MFQTLFINFLNVIEAVPFTGATWFILFILGFFIWLFSKGNRNPKSPLNWEHLIIDPATNRTEPYRLGYLIGLIVGTWLVISLEASNRLASDIFGVYLAYLLGGAGCSVMKSKTSNTSDPMVPDLSQILPEAPPPTIIPPISQPQPQIPEEVVKPVVRKQREAKHVPNSSTQ